MKNAFEDADIINRYHHCPFVEEICHLPANEDNLKAVFSSTK